MGWSIGFDSVWSRDIGYGVPAVCDHTDCNAAIDRGLAFVCCGSQPYGGPDGCGLYFCEAHQVGQKGQCERCEAHLEPFAAKPDTAQWLHHKQTDPSWAEWRAAQSAHEQVRAGLHDMEGRE